MIYNLTGFSDAHIFPFFSNDVIMTSFPATWFSDLHILWNLSKVISLQSFNTVDFLGQVLQRDSINTMVTFFIVLGFEIFILCPDYVLQSYI